MLQCLSSLPAGLAGPCSEQAGQQNASLDLYSISGAALPSIPAISTQLSMVKGRARPFSGVPPPGREKFGCRGDGAMVAEQWEVWLTPCAQSITVPITAAASLDELKEAVLNSCLVAAPELVPVSWLDASRIRQSMVLSARADAGDLTAIRFDDLRTLTPALQADVVPAEEAAALALLQAEEQRRQALGEAAALEALAFARANPLPPPLRSVSFLLKRTVPMYGIGIAWGAQYAKVRPLLQELGLPPWALSVAWLAGPISGLVVQPLVGQLSDRTRGSSRCFAGKRRQWMWTGGLFIIRNQRANLHARNGLDWLFVCVNM